MIPTRWQIRLDAQLADAAERLARAIAHLDDDDGSRSLQSAYQAVVSAATLHVWLTARVWETPLPSSELPPRVQDTFPNLFAALGALDIQQALTAPWRVDAARPYVMEAESFINATEAFLRRCLAEP